MSAMPRRIVKKILPEYFELIVSGKKKYEFRIADFEVEEGEKAWDAFVRP